MARPALQVILLAQLALTFLMPLGAGHAAPPPRVFETRILHDHNDDSAIVLAGKHGFDAIALDVREARLPDGDPALVLRLILNGGCNDQVPTACPTLREVVRFEAPAGGQEVVFETADNGATWSGSAAKYAGPEAINDGTRFAIEGWVPFATFGGSTGTTLADWFVAGYQGEEPADDMPAGVVAGVPDPLGGAFDAGSYTLVEREYVQLTTEDANLTGPVGATVDVAVRVTNLAPLQQNATLQVQGPAVLVPASATILALAPNFTADVTLRITLPNGTAPVDLTVATPLGGFARLAFTAIGEVPAPATPGNATHGDHDHTHEEDKGTPSVGATSLAAAIVAVALVLRRRR